MTATAAVAGWQLYTPEDAKTTMLRMARVVRHALTDPFVVRTAHDIIQGTPPRYYPAQIAAIRLYLETNFYFVDNPIGEQLIQTPASMLHDIDTKHMTLGACDDAAVLAAALGMADGIQARFTAYAFGHPTGTLADRSAPFTHVITSLFDGQGWQLLDVTRPEDMTRLPEVIRTLTVDVEL